MLQSLDDADRLAQRLSSSRGNYLSGTPRASGLRHRTVRPAHRLGLCSGTPSRQLFRPASDSIRCGLQRSLRRQAETAQGIFEGHFELGASPLRETFAGLDEYKPEAIMMALTGTFPAPALAAARRDPIVVREHFRVLREALLAWAEDRTQPEGMPVWQAFQDSAVAALIEARRRFPDGNVLIVSSGEVA